MSTYKYTEEQIVEKFWANVDKREPDECWVWLASKTNHGYGQYRGKAHRWVFNHINGYLPEVVMHTCDNPPCVNPAHLVGSTQLENIADMVRKGRKRKSPATCPKGHNDWAIYKTKEGWPHRECLACSRERARKKKNDND